jgi:hypothetical protein
MKAIDLPYGAIVLERSDFKESWKKRKGLSKIRCFLPPLIRFFTGGYYNHSFIVGDVIYDPDYPRCVTVFKQWAIGKEVEVWSPKEEHDLDFNTILYKPYNLVDTLFYQFIYHLTFRRVWLGRRKGKARRSIYCSEGVCLPYGDLFPFSFRMDTEQLRTELPHHFDCIFVGKLN